MKNRQRSRRVTGRRVAPDRVKDEGEPDSEVATVPNCDGSQILDWHIVDWHILDWLIVAWPSIDWEGRALTSGPFFAGSSRLGRRTAHEFAREAIRRAILRGDLVGGSRVIQTEIAHQLKLSTTPVREAIRDLVTQGLITHDPHRGGIVRELNWEEMHDIVVIRRGLDRAAAELSMGHITDAQIDRAESIAVQLETEHDLGSWVELNEQFHLVFHESTASWRLTTMLKSLEEAAGVYVAQAQRLHPDIRQAAVEHHRTIIDCYRRRDAEELIVVMHEHVALPVKSVSAEL